MKKNRQIAFDRDTSLTGLIRSYQRELAEKESGLMQKNIKPLFNCRVRLEPSQRLFQGAAREVEQVQAV